MCLPPYGSRGTDLVAALPLTKPMNVKTFDVMCSCNVKVSREVKSKGVVYGFFLQSCETKSLTIPTLYYCLCISSRLLKKISLKFICANLFA